MTGAGTYLTLTRERAPTAPAPPRPAAAITTPQRVLFVCTANTARSHLAAALWRQASDISAASAGTHPGTEINPRARAAAERHGTHAAQRQAAVTGPAASPR